MSRPFVIALVLASGCASQYAYQFTPAAGGTAGPRASSQLAEDADLAADVALDPAADAVLVDLTNKTDQVLAVQWASITLARGAGRPVELRPDVDLGWLAPGGHVSARLFALALPHTGPAAAAYEGQTLELDVPVIAHRAPKLYRYAFVAHVKER